MINVMEAIPDIRMRPQKNNRTGKIELGADVQPVFDIAWYTFARLVADVAPPIYKDMNYFKSQGSILTWVACGEFFLSVIPADSALVRSRTAKPNGITVRSKQKKEQHYNSLVVISIIGTSASLSS